MRALSAAAIGIAAGVLFLLSPASALAGTLVPESASSPPGNDIEWLYKVVLYAMAAVFVVIEGALVYIAVRYRARKGDAPARIVGSSKLEVLWTIVPIAVLGVIFGLALSKLDAVANPPGAKLPAPEAIPQPELRQGWGRLNSGPLPEDVSAEGPLVIRVLGLQYLWRFVYPNGAYSYTDLYVPTGRVVQLDVTSADVAHSFFVPKLGGSIDAVPGYMNRGWFKATDPGTYVGQCVEFCGLQHATMQIKVHAVEPSEWQRRIDKERILIEEAQSTQSKQNAEEDAAESAAPEQATAKNGRERR